MDIFIKQDCDHCDQIAIYHFMDTDGDHNFCGKCYEEYLDNKETQLD